MKLKKKEDLGIRIGGHIVLVLLTALAILPFWLLISASFSDPAYATREGYRFFPAELSLEAYQYIFQQWAQIGRAYGVTILVTVLGTVCSLFLVSTYAYALTKDRVRGVKLAFVLCFIPMLFNGGIVSQYLVYSNMLKIKNTLFALIVPNLLFNGFSVILVRNYFKTNIPAELLDAAELDGAGQFYIFRKMVLPMSTPILATIGLITAVSYWNDWTNGLYYITDAKLFSIQQLLNEMNNNIAFLANNAKDLGGIDLGAIPSATIRLAIAVVAILPVLIAYPFFQKFFTKGIAIGAVKG